MPAISNLSAGQGFLQGFQVADQYLNNQEQLQQRRQAIQSAGEQQHFQNDLAVKSDQRAQSALDLQREQQATTDSYRNQQEKHLQTADEISRANLAINQGSARRQQILTDYDLSAKKRQDLKEQALQAGQVAMNGGTPFPVELHDQLIKNGMPALSPYSFMDPKFVDTQKRLGGIVQAVQTGNLNAVNDPDNLSALNEAYHDQVSKGVGDFNSAMGGNVVSKRITQLQAGPQGSVIAHVRVDLDNGKSYDAPMTVARSHDEHDPVKMHDAGTMIDDVVGRYQMAQMADNPKFQQSVRTMFDAATTASLASSGKAGEHLPADAQMIEYLMKSSQRAGTPMSWSDAKDVVLKSKGNPDEMVTKLAGHIMDASAKSMQPITVKEAMQQAREALQPQAQSSTQPQAQQGGTSAAPPVGAQQSAAAQPVQTAAPVQIKSDADYNALPSGTVFVAPDGKTRRKP